MALPLTTTLRRGLWSTGGGALWLLQRAPGQVATSASESSLLLPRRALGSLCGATRCLPRGRGLEGLVGGCWRSLADDSTPRPRGALHFSALPAPLPPTSEPVDSKSESARRSKPPSKREERWDQWYQRLCQFVEERGGSFPYDFSEEELLAEGGREARSGDEEPSPPHSSEELVRLLRWCRAQRSDYRAMRLKPRRWDKLLEIGFVFEPHTVTWNARYRELQEFRLRHGHCQVPSEYPPNPSLAVWVGEQRYHFKKLREGRPSSMTPDRIARLEALDFEWNVNDARWLERYRELEEHVRLNGIGRAPPGRQNPSLRRWLEKQRQMYRAKLESGAKNSLKPEREQLLRKLGLLW